MVTESETVKRHIKDLRVVDLKNELETRGLDKTGVKALLVERLSKVLQDEGHNPEEYRFEVTEKKTLKRNSIGKQDQDCVSNPDSTADGVDVSNAHEMEEDFKEELGKEDRKENDRIRNSDDEAPVLTKDDEGGEESTPPTAPDLKCDAASNHENNDVVEDCINLNLEDEENFDEEENHAKEKVGDPMHNVEFELKDSAGFKNIMINFLVDEPPTQRRGLAQHEDKSKTSSIGAAAGQGSSNENTEASAATSASSTSASKNDADQETMEDKDIKSTSLETSSSTPSSGEKAKSGPVASKDGSKIPAKDDRDKKKSPGNSINNSSSSRNLWVSGLSTNTKANDLKHIFSKYGKVMGAKVVTSVRTPGARCFGYVTMNSSEEASKCIQHLHRTELHGRMISVERAKGDNSPRKAVPKSDPKPSAETTTEKTVTEKKNEDTEVASKAENAEADVALSAVGDSSAASAIGSTKDKEESKSVKDDKEMKLQQHRAKEREKRNERNRRPPSPHRPRQAVLTFHQIRDERDRQRQREREREEREAERRRREDIARQREHDRKQREEAMRLEKERERLRIERERLEREKAELIRLERERQRLERERIEQEREELQRQKARSLARMEEVRRATKRTTSGERDDYFVDRKRLSVDVPLRYDSQPQRYDQNKSNKHFPSAPAPNDYNRMAKPIIPEPSRSFDNRNRFERPIATPAASITRRVVQEVTAPPREGRHPPSPPPRERDDRRVVRDDRYDRGNRSAGRDVFTERDRERERDRAPRDRDREPVRNRLDRDHHDRYSDTRSKGESRFNDRGADNWRPSGSSGGSGGVGSSLTGNSKNSYGNSSSSSILGNGGAVPHAQRDSHHVWGAANERKSETMLNSSSTSSWNGQSSSSDRWSSSNMLPIGRSITTPGGFSNNWTGSSAPISNSVYNPTAGSLGSLSNVVLGQSGSVNYSADRYSRH